MIATGVLSRLIHTGFVLFDKYLGDALYAAMVYLILRLVRPRSGVALAAMSVMTAVELFQLTLIPAGLMQSSEWAVRMVARLLGTQFAFGDLIAYAVGIAAITAVDAWNRREPPLRTPLG